MKNLFMLLFALLSLTSFCQDTNKAMAASQMKNEVWQMELRYWSDVEKNDTADYKRLWHENFIGYPGNDVSGKAHIADWIADLYKDKTQHHRMGLHKKAVNEIDGVVMTFYDVEDTLTDDQNKLISKDISKITHTWKKYGNAWLIIGGMSGGK